MKKKSLLFTLVLTNIVAQATTISFSGDSIFESDGLTPLEAGSYVSVGYFDDGFDFSNIPSLTWLDLSSSYTEIIGNNSSINPAGEVGIGVTETGILDENLYVWFFDTKNTPVLITEQEYGLFSSTSNEWTAKGDGSFDFNTLLLSDIDVVEYGSIATNGVSLAPVPEPSTYALFAGILALGFIVIRRSRSRS